MRVNESRVYDNDSICALQFMSIHIELDFRGETNWLFKLSRGIQHHLSAMRWNCRFIWWRRFDSPEPLSNSSQKNSHQTPYYYCRAEENWSEPWNSKPSRTTKMNTLKRCVASNIKYLIIFCLEISWKCRYPFNRHLATKWVAKQFCVDHSTLYSMGK